MKALMTGKLGRARRGRGERGAPSGGREPPKVSVSLMVPTAKRPASAIERFAVSILEREREVPYERLVLELGEKAYLAEIRRGAAVLDLGLFRADLFVPDIVTELEAGNGILWKIELQEERKGT